MSDTLIETFRSLLTPDVVGRVASATGENSSSVSKAMSAAGALVLGGLVERADEPGKMSQIMNLLTNPATTGALGNLSSLVATGSTSPQVMDLGANFLSSIFGNKQPAVATALSQYAGIRSTSASSLLGWVAPIVMGLLGDRVRKEGLSPASLSSWLANQRDLLGSIPALLLGAAGFGGVRAPGSRESGAAAAATLPPVERRPVSWLWPAVLGALLLIGLVTWLARSKRVEAPDISAVAAPARDAARDAGDAARRAADATGRALADLGAFFTRRLPNGVELDIPSLGIENKVVEFIEDTGQPLEPARWFDFDRLLFATNSATLEPQSQEQLGNIAKILEAYPSVRVKIGGYTDNTGSPAANLKLSQDRATSVRNELVRLGVPGERLEAEGYGQEHPVADNSTEAGRAQNRRIALRVTQR